MKMRLMVMSLMALMTACTGTVQEPVIDQDMGLSQQGPESIGGGGPCGTNYCNKGYFCCNAGCGVCAPLNGGCPDVMCN